MRLTTLTIAGYRCFDEETAVPLNDITALVGTNGAGKSALLRALACMFGITQAERTLHKDDFHLRASDDPDRVAELNLRIEATLEFPELSDSAAPKDAVAATFKHMAVTDDTRKTPYCRIRLDGMWRRSSLQEGEVTQALCWVTSAPGAVKEITCALLPADRSRIHVHYIPAVRDPLRQIRQVSGSILHRLLRAIEWSDFAREAAAEAANTVQSAFDNEAGLSLVEAAIQGCWREVYGQPQHANVSVRPIARRFEDLLRNVEASFSPGVDAGEAGTERLSDGQKSLFYLALVAAVFDVERSLSADEPSIDRDVLNPPVLTLFAVEEPENHVAPHFLGRVMAMYRRISEAPGGQVIFSSHSPSILARVDPSEVRYVRSLVEPRASKVTTLQLPVGPHEQEKYVRTAVRAHPELYFARFVVLGEGDSEAVVLPRIANALGVELDQSLVTFAPLGGRHVNHFWLLLSSLGIPCVTLLDLDLDRTGGGWGRIKYALQQLLKLFSEDEVLALTKSGGSGKLTKLGLQGMHKWGTGTAEDQASLACWRAHLESFGVYFSDPLDLDYLMLRAFPKAYEATVEEGALDVPSTGADFAAALPAVLAAVFKTSASSVRSYDENDKRAFFWYRHLFLARGKPSTHMLALETLSDEELTAGLPEVLRRLCAEISDELNKTAASNAS